MSGTHKPEVLVRSIAKTRQWIDETAAEIGTDDHRAAFRALRAIEDVMGVLPAQVRGPLEPAVR